MDGRGAGVGTGDVSVADSPLATIESLTQAAVIAVMGVAIVVSNLLIIAAFLNFKGRYTDRRKSDNRFAVGVQLLLFIIF